MGKKDSGDNEVRYLHSTWLRRKDLNQCPVAVPEKMFECRGISPFFRPRPLARLPASEKLIFRRRNRKLGRNPDDKVIMVARRGFRAERRSNAMERISPAQGGAAQWSLRRRGGRLAPLREPVGRWPHNLRQPPKKHPAWGAFSWQVAPI